MQPPWGCPALRPEAAAPPPPVLRPWGEGSWEAAPARAIESNTTETAGRKVRSSARRVVRQPSNCDIVQMVFLFVL